MRLVGGVVRHVEDGVVLITSSRQRYFVPARELRGMRLERGMVLTFRPAQGASGAAIALDVRRLQERLSGDRGRTNR